MFWCAGLADGLRTHTRGAMRTIILSTLLLACCLPAVADVPSVDQHYLVFQLTNIPREEFPARVNELAKTYGPSRPAEGRMLAFGPTSILTLKWSVEEMRDRVNEAFDLAEAHDVAVYFQVDDMHFLPDEIIDDPAMHEWLAFPEPGEDHGPRAPYWFNWGMWMRFPACPNYASPSFRAFAMDRFQRGFLEPVVERVNRLDAAGKGHLFAGAAVGWETHVPDYTPGAMGYNIDPANPPADTRTDPPVVMTPEEMGPVGYAALHTLGWDQEKLDREAAARGVEPRALFTELLHEVIADYTVLWCKTALDAGIPREKIFTHIIPLDTVTPTTSSFCPPVRAAVNPHSVPGFTLNSQTAPFDLDVLKQKIREADPEQDQFMCAETYFLGYNTFDLFAGLLRDMYGNGATHIVIWGNTDPATSPYIGYPRDGAVRAASDWMRGGLGALDR
jgi:hypothetical protein